jgi:hypothetical protein
MSDGEWDYMPTSRCLTRYDVEVVDGVEVTHKWVCESVCKFVRVLVCVCEARSGCPCHRCVLDQRRCSPTAAALRIAPHSCAAVRCSSVVCFGRRAQVNEYKVIRSLGSGSFGTAYLAERAASGAEVASASTSSSGDGVHGETAVATAASGEAVSGASPARQFAIKVFKRSKLRSVKELVRRGADTVRRAGS